MCMYMMKIKCVEDLLIEVNNNGVAFQVDIILFIFVMHCNGGILRFTNRTCLLLVFIFK